MKKYRALIYLAVLNLIACQQENQTEPVIKLPIKKATIKPAQLKIDLSKLKLSISDKAEPDKALLNSNPFDYQRLNKTKTNTSTPKPLKGNLTRHPLKQIKMVGILAKGSAPEQVWAILQMPDGQVAHISQGSIVALERALVESISMVDKQLVVSWQKQDSKGASFTVKSTLAID